jgi:Fur family ferric uptake transcriptional regulator
MNPSKQPRSFPCGRPRAARKGRSASRELLEKLHHYQSSQKLNRSQTREKILAVLATQSDHFVGPELVEKVRKAHPEIGAATVYRNLPVFLEAGIIRESLTDRNGQVVYEVQHSGHHHDHVVCLDCRAILEFHEVGIESLQAKVLERLGFQEVQHSHVIYAHCIYRKGVT